MRQTNTILLVGGELCERIAARLDPDRWTPWGLRRRPMQSSGMRWLQGDLHVPESLQSLPHGITHVLYAPAPDRRDRESYQAAYPIGVRNLLNALEKSASIERMVLIGSSAVWPATRTADAAWVTEDTPTAPCNFRSEAILQAELELRNRLPGRNVALRLGGLYGPGRTRLIDNLRAGSVTAPDGPGHWSNRIHIDDAASACVHLLALAHPAACYIGTDGRPTETAAFYDALAHLLHVPRPARQWRPPSGKRLSNARLVASGWAPCWPDALAGYTALAGEGAGTEPAR